ncbi:hypothetical protein B0H14DRAFT_1170194 [Mycena olivaceomarginata]|nr:hypothetical protein B0H14DRAFT_1170194 [Mycena olivaceomarginata]
MKRDIEECYKVLNAQEKRSIGIKQPDLNFALSMPTAITVEEINANMKTMMQMFSTMLSPFCAIWDAGYTSSHHGASLAVIRTRASAYKVPRSNRGGRDSVLAYSARKRTPSFLVVGRIKWGTFCPQWPCSPPCTDLLSAVYFPRRYHLRLSGTQKSYISRLERVRYFNH